MEFNSNACKQDLKNTSSFSYLVPQKQTCCKSNQLQTREICKEIKYSKSFPPPLSSINGVKVEARREGGRLLITAFSFSTRIYLKALRENGRLRLSLVKDGSAAKIEDEEEEEDEDEEKIRHRRGGIDLFSSRCNGDGSKKLPTLPVCVAFS